MVSAQKDSKARHGKSQMEEVESSNVDTKERECDEVLIENMLTFKTIHCVIFARREGVIELPLFISVKSL